jgi:hypothetical protein
VLFIANEISVAPTTSAHDSIPTSTPTMSPTTTSIPQTTMTTTAKTPITATQTTISVPSCKQFLLS